MCPNFLDIHIFNIMRQILLLLILSLSLLFGSYYAFDISFIRTDDKDSTVPLSAKYREQLRKLCKVLEKNSKLPKDLEAKKEELAKMCMKLKKDDENIESAESSGIINNKFARKALLVGALVGSGWFAWKNAHMLLSFIPFLGNGKASVGISQEATQDMRDARLKRFSAELPNKID